MAINNICVYRHRRLDTNKIFYIGIGNGKRPYSTKYRNKYWNNIISKTKYKIEIISENLSWQDACELEILLISEYGRLDNNTGILCNMTNGGEGNYGLILSNESKEKIRQFNLGKIISEEEKHRLRTMNIGRVKPIEERIKLSKSLTGRIRSYEHKINLSKNSYNKRKIICLKTNKIWESIASCAIENNLNKYVLASRLRGDKKNNTTFKYLENDK